MAELGDCGEVAGETDHYKIAALGADPRPFTPAISKALNGAFYCYTAHR